jgi:hypothetical protein
VENLGILVPELKADGPERINWPNCGKLKGKLISLASVEGQARIRTGMTGMPEHMKEQTTEEF